MADELNNEALELNKITVNGYEFEVTDSSARTDIDDISDAIVINNASISSRINDLNNRLETIENTDYAMADDLEEDERTTAAALNDLNDRLLAFENGTATSNYATESYVDTQISNLVNGAPAALDTLKEIADMLDNDQSVAGGIIQQLETKANSTDVYTKTAADNKFATIENLEEDEEVINAALNDLNSRVEVFEATGVQGPQGAQGEQGVQGSQGEQGVQGEVGSQGPQGEQGQGIDGYSKTVADAKFATIEELEKDEKTIAAALNDLNSKLATDVYTKTQSDAKYATIEDVIDNEEVIAEAISQLSDRVDTLESGSGSGSGEGGSQGSQGVQGPQGTQGPQGETGSQGNQGTQGEQGSQGNQGTQGPQGETGSQGNQGTQGTQGETGSQGSQGAQGVQGETGSQGSQGAQGVQGDSHIPSVTSSDNGKILMVVNGVWTLVSPTILYSGSGAPNNSQGNNGDIYVQTNE